MKSLKKNKKKDRACLLQAIETLQMTAGESDRLGKRIVANFDTVFVELSQSV
jgi:hypothetical protein